MKRFTKKILHRIYTVEINVKENYVKIIRGRGGQQDTKPIFTDNEFAYEGGEYIRRDCYGDFFDSYGKVSAEKLEEIIKNKIVMPILKDLEKKIQKKKGLK